MSTCVFCGRVQPHKRSRGDRTVARPIPCGASFLGFTGQSETCILALMHSGPCESVQTLARTT